LLIDYSSSWVQKPILQGGPFFRGKTNMMFGIALDENMHYLIGA
jgi:hypothetical protein